MICTISFMLRLLIINLAPTALCTTIPLQKHDLFLNSSIIATNQTNLGSGGRPFYYWEPYHFRLSGGNSGIDLLITWSDERFSVRELTWVYSEINSWKVQYWPEAHDCPRTTMEQRKIWDHGSGVQISIENEPHRTGRPWTNGVAAQTFSMLLNLLRITEEGYPATVIPVSQRSGAKYRPFLIEPYAGSDRGSSSHDAHSGSAGRGSSSSSSSHGSSECLASA